MYYYNKYWLNPISTIKQGKLGNKIVKNNFLGSPLYSGYN